MAVIMDTRLWSWFDKRSLLRLNVGKNRNPSKWVLTRGKRGEQGFKIRRFDTLRELLLSLYEHEMESLWTELKIPPTVILGIMADDMVDEDDILNSLQERR